MKRIVLVVLLALASALPASAQNILLRSCTAHIVSATTTTLTGCGAVTDRTYSIYTLSVCLGAGGVSTNVTVQDSAGTNLIGPNQVYPLPNPGACLVSDPYRGFRFWSSTAAGTGIQIVTSAGGPVEVYAQVSY